MADLVHALTFADVGRQHARSSPTATALVCGDHRSDFATADRRSSQLANALAARGVGTGDRVLWLGQNCHRVLETLAAVAKLGAVLCPANWRQTAEELRVVLDDLRPTVVIWQHAEIGDTVRAARAAATHDAIWIRHDPDQPAEAESGRNGGGDSGGDETYEAILAAAPIEDPAIEVDPAAPLLALYTAAFTGTPNAALLPHAAVLAQNLVMAMVQELSSEYRYLNSGPLFHVATLMTTLATYHVGGTNVFTPRVDAAELCRLVATERCTGAFLMPPTIKEIVELNADGEWDLSCLRTFPIGKRWSAMTSPDSSPWAVRPAGYGQTEVMGMLTLNAWGPESIGNAGRPTPVVSVRIVDPSGDEVAPGETGEIVARGPTVCAGYHDRPELNAERLRGGWWHTNDLGRIEADGSLTFVGPRTRIVKSAAENIYPAEVEACLREHPAVADAAIIGVPDPTWTQSVKAIVVLRPDAEVSADELIAHCRARIASYKKPRTIEFVDELPRIGFAVDYDSLDATFGGGGYPGS